jgi:subtilisin family serine protease
VSLIHSIESNPNVVGADLTYFGNMLFSLTPTDPRFGEQPYLTKIRADEAWYIARGSNQVIAVVDSGVDNGHPDLAEKIIMGKDFVDGDMVPTDYNGHGTHVAGIAAATTDNGEGVAGVAWGSKVLAVRVLDWRGNAAYYNALADGISYAVESGVSIINVSAGFTREPQSAGLACYLKEQLGIIPQGTCQQEVIAAINYICQVVETATNKGIMIVAASGNKGNLKEKSYPAACPTAIAVGATTSSDTRAWFSHYGPWVDIAAPGEGILSTFPTSEYLIDSFDRDYHIADGTSSASPMIAGAAAVVWSRFPELTAAKVEERLKKTAKKLPGEQLGEGRLDLFEAVFDGSFEEGELALWKNSSTVASIDGLGPLIPQDRERMGYASTGPAGAQTSGSLSQAFQVQEGVTTLPITFKYAFISEEFPEWVGSQFDDSLEIKLKAPNGSVTTLASESINSSAYSAISGLDFPGGDSTVGWTGWKTVTMEIPITSGEGEYEMVLEDAGDSIYDTVLLIDHIQFK